MWLIFYLISASCLILAGALMIGAYCANKRMKRKFSVFNFLFAGIFISALFAFMPVHIADAPISAPIVFNAILQSIFNSMQIFAMGCEYAVAQAGLEHCPAELQHICSIWMSVIFVLAPIFTFSFVLSMFKNLSATVKYLVSWFKDAYVFSELNESSVILASDIKANHENAVIVFTDVFENNEEKIHELIEKANVIGAICFKKDMLAVKFKNHSKKRKISFFAMSADEAENLNHSLKVLEAYKQRDNTHLYVFSTKKESELMLNAAEKGKVKVRRINEVQSLVNRVLYDTGEVIFDSAREAEDGVKDISAVIVGMGRYGTEMTKALAWFGQMDGYRITVNIFDKDPLAESKFRELAPELMSDAYNGKDIKGEAQYTIKVHSGLDVQTVEFTDELEKITNATYVLVALGDDDTNIETAICIRMHFERIGIRPVIRAIVYNSQQKAAMKGIKNYRGQEYGIDFIGDLESSYAENVIIDSELENDALQRHLKWGNEEEFWAYEYNYRSSAASAIHMKARKKCGIKGADKKESELTTEERDTIEVLEHRRWNAYMRAEGYVYSGSQDKKSRNDLAKMHHDLVDYALLDEETKRKDSKVGTE